MHCGKLVISRHVNIPQCDSKININVCSICSVQTSRCLRRIFGPMQSISYAIFHVVTLYQNYYLIPSPRGQRKLFIEKRLYLLTKIHGFRTHNTNFILNLCENFKPDNTILYYASDFCPIYQAVLYLHTLCVYAVLCVFFIFFIFPYTFILIHIVWSDSLSICTHFISAVGRLAEWYWTLNKHFLKVHFLGILLYYYRY